MSVIQARRGLSGLWLAVVLLGGCSVAEFGGDVRVPASEEMRLTNGAAGAGPISLPADRGFNIHIKKSSQEPGPAGTATSSADATADGQAFCQAQASNGGVASAEFNIGHRFHNQSDVAQATTIKLAYELEQAVTASDQPTAKTIGTAQMQLVVLDSHKRIMASMKVAQTSSDEARGTAKDHDQRELALEFAAHQSYDIMLFGQVQAKSDTGQEASARLAVRQLTMKVSFAPRTQPAQP